MNEWFGKIANIYVIIFFNFFLKQKYCFPNRKEDVIKDKEYDNLENNNNLVVNHNSNSSEGQSK